MAHPHVLISKSITLFIALAFSPFVWALPTGGAVVEGSAGIATSGNAMTVTQATPKAIINWEGFSIGATESVHFAQSNASSVTLNRVIGADPSHIMGALTATGKVFLVNPNGVLFGAGSSVNVGGLTASTLGITNADFMSGNYEFSGASQELVSNLGTINAIGGGYVALLGANVSNDGIIAAQLGSVALAAGNAVTLDVAGDKLLNVVVTQGAVDALVANRNLIKADGGLVLMTTQAAGSLLSNAVNNSGVIQAQTIGNVGGTIKLLGGMENGTVSAAGTLDASAPAGGNGGVIETSAANLTIADGIAVTTAAGSESGSWLISSQDFTVGSGGIANSIAGSTLNALLDINNVTINTANGAGAALPGNGDILVNDALSWTPSGRHTTLTLNAAGDVHINNAITAVGGSLKVCCGQDINVAGAISTTDGSVLLSAGRNVNMDAAMTTTRGNIMICAANDVNVDGAITLTDGTTDPTRSLGLPRGLVLSAGYGGTGPGSDGGGTLIFGASAPPVTITNAPVEINYNPVSYTTPTPYSGNFTRTGANQDWTQRMLVFADGGDKAFDGTTSTTLSSLKGNPFGVELVAGPGSTANYDTAGAGSDKTISYNGYSLTGANMNDYALAMNCCGPVFARTTGTIAAAAIPPPVVPVPDPVEVTPVAPGRVLPNGQVVPDATSLPLWPITQPVPPAIVPPGPVPSWMAPPMLALLVAPPTSLPSMMLVEDRPVAPPIPYIAPVFIPKHGRN